MYFDSHAHLDYEDIKGAGFDENVKAIERSDVDYVMDIGVDLATSKKAAENAGKYSWCYAAIGYHPHEAKGMSDIELEMIKALAKNPKVMAIGEIGLDFHYEYSPKDVQRDVFRRQIELANQLKMPIVIHSREADQEVMDILKEEGAFSEERKSWFPKRPLPVEESEKSRSWLNAAYDARVLLHCFSGSREMGEQYVKLGGTISIAGPVTYKNNRKTTEVVGSVPLEFMLIETDAPFLAPEPKRGKANMSPYIEFTAMRVAAIKGITLDETASKTTENAKRFFGID
ncbi:MAG TPA: TatD family hydrolase [Bacillota bacterium]|nr:TatD family hydrolase [Bacillota bacterium]HUM55668.1 TatD family hydrolase [Bacillota bacterium]